MRCVLQVRFYDQELGWEAWAVFGPNDVHKQVGSPTVNIDHILYYSVRHQPRHARLHRARPAPGQEGDGGARQAERRHHQ